ncbi:MAG: NACHT domain-containing protein, partial [Anaerolineae bacterium]
MRRRIVFFLLLAILLAVLALTVPRWAPPLLNFIGANSDLIQGAEALLAIVTALLSALSLLATFFFSRQPRQTPDASPPATETSNVSSQGAIVGGNVTSGGQFSGRDSYNFHAPVIITGQPPVLPPVSADLTPARDAYLAYVLDRHQFLSLKGMGVSDRVPLKLPLLDLYVPLQARLELPEGETWRRNLRLAGRPLNPDEQVGLTGRLSEPRPVLDLIQAHDGLVVLGDPGAGKTTFLKYLALQLALGHGPAIGLGNRLPILAPLSGFANALAAGSVRLDDYIANYFHDIGVDLPVAALLQQALDKGQALVLLDGLDEVKETGLRHTVVQQVVDFYTAQRRRG